jgi:hypothetical protein
VDNSLQSSDFVRITFDHLGRTFSQRSKHPATMKNRVKSRSIGIIVFLSQRLPIGSEPDERVTVFGQRALIDPGGARSGRRWRRRAFD